MIRLSVFFLLVVWLIGCRSGDSSPQNGSDQSSTIDSTAQPSTYQELLEKGDTATAIKVLDQYLRTNPTNEQAGLELAWLYAYQKDSTALSLTRWLSNSKEALIGQKALYIEAHYYGNIGKWEHSLELLNKVIQQNFQFIDAYIQKGIIQLEHQKADDALKTFMLGLKIEPSNADLYYWIAETHKALGHKEEALDWQKKYEALQ